MSYREFRVFREFSVLGLCVSDTLNSLNSLLIGAVIVFTEKKERAEVSRLPLAFQKQILINTFAKHR